MTPDPSKDTHSAFDEKPVEPEFHSLIKVCWSTLPHSNQSAHSYITYFFLKDWEYSTHSTGMLIVRHRRQEMCSSFYAAGAWTFVGEVRLSNWDVENLGVTVR